MSERYVTVGMSYSIGYEQRRMLLPLCESESERAAIERLHDFRGSESDLRLAAELYRSVGEHANADDLLDIIGDCAKYVTPTEGGGAGRGGR